MGFPNHIAEKALLDCGRCCCICHKFCGFKMELHHIIQKSEGGEDSYDNCIPLCFDCHAEIKFDNSKHPKGRKYSNSEIKSHRNRWYKKVNNQNVIIVNPECIQLDRTLFLKIRAILSSYHGSILFVRQHIYNHPFKIELLNDLDDYIALCKHPDFEFIDSDLEIRRSQLRDSIEEYLYLVSYNTFPIENQFGEQKNYVDPSLKLSNPTLYYQTVEDLGQAAQKLCSAYDDLVRLGRRKLGVE